MDPAARTQLFKTLVLEQGFDQVGIAAAGRSAHADYARRWFTEGRAGEMAYLQRRMDARLDARRYLPGARSVVVAALNYHQPEPPAPDDRPRGRIARYAWGNDYHELIKTRLWQVIDIARQRLDQPFEARPCVDTAPLLERELAMQAGLGWIGKNTLVLNSTLGSYFFLGEIVTTLELTPDAPAADHCGSCTRCLEACPTAAFPQAYQMDATRCISYHTIELRQAIPTEFHSAIGEWVFGCDLCQEVCPFNRQAPTEVDPELELRAPGPRPALQDLLQWSAEHYRQTVRGSALRRAKHDMIQRNARIALDNHEHGGGPHRTAPPSGHIKDEA